MENIPNSTEVREKSSRVVETTADAVTTVSERLDAARQYVSDKTQQVKESFNQIRQQELQALKSRATEYTRRQPFSALLIAFGAGVLLGLFNRRRQ
jgi:ElaB/YqjD/DUF883 family membrane-anchored ribosome-binding protein